MNKPLRIKIIFCLLAAIEAIFCFTPLGSIPMPLGMVATLSCIPVIITSLTLGPGYGGVMGFLFGIFSFLVWTITPPNPAFAFVWTPFYNFGGMHGNFFSLVICFVPRILSGVFPSLIYRRFKREDKSKDTIRVISSVIGSLTNTILVLAGIFIFFGSQYESIYNGQPDVTKTTILALIGATILSNGIPECIVCAIVCPIIVRILKLKDTK